MTLFLFGTFWFWLLISIAIFIMTLTTETDSPNGWPTFVLILTVGILYISGNKSLMQDFLQNLGTNIFLTLSLVFLYLMIGVVWSFFKWGRILHKEKASNLSLFENCYKNNADKVDIKQFLNERMPKIEEYKSLIISSIIYWPFSILWYILRHLFSDIMQRVFNSFKGAYIKLANHIYKV